MVVCCCLLYSRNRQTDSKSLLTGEQGARQICVKMTNVVKEYSIQDCGTLRLSTATFQHLEKFRQEQLFRVIIAETPLLRSRHRIQTVVLKLKNEGTRP